MASPLQLVSSRPTSVETSSKRRFAPVSVQNAGLRAFRVDVALKGVVDAAIEVPGTQLVDGVYPDVGQKEIQQPVIVIVEQNAARGVTRVVETSGFRGIAEAPFARRSRTADCRRGP